jgi:predicted metal-binding membrane protein
MSGANATGWPGFPATPGGIGLWPTVRATRLLLGLLGALIGLAWVSLWIWKASPYGRYLSHEENAHVTTLGTGYATVVLLFVAGWTLMTVAMMLPTSLPLVATFSAIVRARANRASLVAILVLGYLAVWTAFAFVAHAGDLGIHKTVDRVGWLHRNEWVIAAGTFALAGAYQFSSLKYRCLEKCRSPVAFVLQHWHGGRERLQALALGVHHGLFCLGCCWSLMLLMFALGIANLGWMLVLAALMAAEKNAPWGRRLSAPVGIVLLAVAAVLAGAGLAGHQLLGGE